MNKTIPLIFELSATSTVAFYAGRVIQQQNFLHHVAETRKLLDNHQYNINLCENRYHFLVVFAACTSRGQISLLPSSRADKELERLQETYPDSDVIDDHRVANICQQQATIQFEEECYYQIESDQIVAMVFTSGSTGVPQANPKSWGQLVASAQRVKARFKFNDKQQHVLVATVPPQHMFGFETSIVYPLVLGVAIDAGRPFYPLDIQQTLSSVPAPRVLITTPIHLAACNGKQEGWPDIDFIVSATSPLSEKVASEAEKILNTSVREIYGCSEAGAIASRQMTVNSQWHLLNEYKIESNKHTALLTVPGREEPIFIPDQVEVSDKQHFKLIGRNSDLVNIGGKRGSLTELSNKLKEIDGVSDAVFIMPDEKIGKRTRLAALVIAPGGNIADIRAELAKSIDAVFLPRPLMLVSKLPYNESGKLPRVRLLEKLKSHLDKTVYQETA